MAEIDGSPYDFGMQVFLGLGGNLGDVRGRIQLALRLLDQLPEVSRLRCSPLYVTSPVSPLPQPNYLNGVCQLETTLSVKELWDEVVRIEKVAGKRAKGKEEPREIDIDLLLFGDLTYEEGGLQVPHPRWEERLFVLRPLLDLTETVQVGKSVKNIRQMIAGYRGDEVVQISSCSYASGHDFQEEPAARCLRNPKGI